MDAITCMKVPPNWVCSFILLSCLISTTANYNYVKAFKTWMKFIYMCNFSSRRVFVSSKLSKDES